MVRTVLGFSIETVSNGGIMFIEGLWCLNFPKTTASVTSQQLSQHTYIKFLGSAQACLSNWLVRHEWGVTCGATRNQLEDTFLGQGLGLTWATRKTDGEGACTEQEGSHGLGLQTTAKMWCLLQGPQATNQDTTGRAGQLETCWVAVRPKCCMLVIKNYPDLVKPKAMRKLRPREATCYQRSNDTFLVIVTD